MGEEGWVETEVRISEMSICEYRGGVERAFETKNEGVIRQDSRAIRIELNDLIAIKSAIGGCGRNRESRLACSACHEITRLGHVCNAGAWATLTFTV